MGTIYARVSRVADWEGWCSPCEREDRPLVLTRSGPAGLRAWLEGLGDDDRLLLLTCRVCGEWQHVPAREEDDPEVVLVHDDVLDAVTAAVSQAREVPAPVAVAPVPAPRTEEPVRVELPQPASDVDPLLAAELATEPAVEPAVEVAVEAAPRPPVPRIVTVPESVALPVPREAVEAAARVLAAARAQNQRTPSTGDRPAPLERSRRPRTAPTPRRAARPVTTRTLRPVDAIVALPPAIGVPTGTHQVVLAAAS